MYQRMGGERRAFSCVVERGAWLNKGQHYAATRLLPDKDHKASDMPSLENMHTQPGKKLLQHPPPSSCSYGCTLLLHAQSCTHMLITNLACQCTLYTFDTSILLPHWDRCRPLDQPLANRGPLLKNKPVTTFLTPITTVCMQESL